MRLICPNCDATYEVSDDAIPDEGRDVQCSSCGHAWFQRQPALEVAAAEEAALFGDDLVAPADAEIDPAEADQPQADPSVASDADLSAAFSAAFAEPPEAPAPAAPVPAAPVRQELDGDVLAVLREEAEREADARRAEVQRAGSMRAEAEGQMQVQPDLGVEAPALTPTQRRLAMLQGKDPDAPPPEPARPVARRDLLPDVEEINSTLNPNEDLDELDAEVDALPDLVKGRSGFRSGFFLMILLAVIAAAVYMAAPKLIAQFPSLEESLTAYVRMVDAMRLQLNELMNSATHALKGDG
ncbi:MAG: zinc-ribbon domain-containing protein [Paracoccaceae bacterium]